jgi:tRNA modification GTPase
MDLAQAEAVADLIEARAGSGARAAWNQLQGALSDRLAALRETIIGVLADVEANVDFSDEELPTENLPARVELIEGVCADIDSLLATFEMGRRHREGIRVVMLGPPNVGKSSLVNALLGEERMIVSDEPGTTRDSVQETVDLEGAALLLTDTAGVRDTPSAAEGAAVARSKAEVDHADFVILVCDGSRELGVADLAIVSGAAKARGLVAVNKMDLPSRWSRDSRREVEALGWPIVETSAVSGEGCDRLRSLLREFVATADTELGEPVVLGRVRHRTGLEAARSSLRAAVELLGKEAMSELAALELRSALDAIAGVTDPLGNEEVLDRVFSEFCLGK